LNFCLEIPLVIAIQSLERVAGIQAIKPASLDLIPQLSRHVCVELALPAFESLPLIPSIWTTQFKREEIDLLGKSAPIFFVSMSAVWTNLPLSIAQLPATPSASPCNPSRVIQNPRRQTGLWPEMQLGKESQAG
jgi:hypothetical protein